ncbi:hypothetical protein Bra3105_13045 [Brachybacterium halotolerans subsp. kimchii]|uniref:hypothetical protein n=1 Tax=Brachybacterium halotolerans TaxID=2795215 RepID=UPI001E31CB5A|nr:hypothetical protein [Brachybacterium halotolerans]UEJ81764.1 hypothetical protein Bra3105_13045 [Brachybacterium halotolerans subsp. kimchii]
MGETLFPRYRAQKESRVAANNAMMALLAGSRLASHTLQLTEGSKVELGQIFPAVEHIGRFNLKTDSARTILQSADAHIASVAVPYALAVHEAFVLDLIEFVNSETGSATRPPKAWEMHEVFFHRCNSELPEKELQVFHVVRELRNTIIHSQGVDKRGALRRAVAAAEQEARAEWERLNGGVNLENLVDSRGVAQLEATHIFTAFAVSKALARSMNEAITQAIPRENWARIAVLDFSEATTKIKNSAGWRRAAVGYSKKFYEPVRLSENNVEQAARQCGLWSIHEWR